MEGVVFVCLYFDAYVGKIIARSGTSAIGALYSGERSLGIVHAFALHVLEDGLSMFLLFLLDVVEDIPYLCVLKLEYRGVISAGHIFLGHKYICTQALIVRYTGVVRPNPSRRVRLLRAHALPLVHLAAALLVHSRHLPAEDLVQSIQMLLLLLGMIIEYCLQLRI